MKYKYNLEKYTLGHTGNGLIFGTILFWLCLGIVSSSFVIVIKHFHLFELNRDIVYVIVGGGSGFSFVFSFKIAKRYWNWADRAMAKLFGSNGDKQEG